MITKQKSHCNLLKTWNTNHLQNTNSSQNKVSSLLLFGRNRNIQRIWTYEKDMFQVLLGLVLLSLKFSMLCFVDCWFFLLIVWFVFCSLFVFLPSHCQYCQYVFDLWDLSILFHIIYHYINWNKINTYPFYSCWVIRDSSMNWKIN